MRDILLKIYNLCAVRETSSWMEMCTKNIIPNRFVWIINYLNTLGIPYEVDEFTVGNAIFRNIKMLGSSKKWAMAHYDIINTNSDNANDNSASVINLIALKFNCPSLNAVIVDGEEPPFFGIGSERLAHTIPDDAQWVLNLDVTGRGTHILVSNYCHGNLYHEISEKCEAISYMVPWNDSISFLQNNSTIECEIVVLADKLENEQIDTSHFGNIHSSRDSVVTIRINDMENLVNKLSKLIQNN